MGCIRTWMAAISAIAVLAACSGEEPKRTSPPERSFDACRVLTKTAVTFHLKAPVTKESYESGIGPGCVYRHKETFIGINIQRFQLARSAWRQTIVLPVAASQPGATQKDVPGLGGAAVWIASKNSTILHVWAGGKAFDIYLSLSQKNDPKKHLRVATPLAKRILEGLKTYIPSPAASPVAT